MRNFFIVTTNFNVNIIRQKYNQTKFFLLDIVDNNVEYAAKDERISKNHKDHKYMHVFTRDTQAPFCIWNDTASYTHGET